VPAIHVLAVVPVFYQPPWIPLLPFCHGGDCSHNERVVLGALAEQVCSCSDYAELGLIVGPTQNVRLCVSAAAGG
jgi:hypothetical protein